MFLSFFSVAVNLFIHVSFFSVAVNLFMHVPLYLQLSCQLFYIFMFPSFFSVAVNLFIHIPFSLQRMSFSSSSSPCSGGCSVWRWPAVRRSPKGATMRRFSRMWRPTPRFQWRTSLSPPGQWAFLSKFIFVVFCHQCDSPHPHPCPGVVVSRFAVVFSQGLAGVVWCASFGSVSQENVCVCGGGGNSGCTPAPTYLSLPHSPTFTQISSPHSRLTQLFTPAPALTQISSHPLPF